MTSMTLDPTLRRVLGVLIEKAKTTPGSYPMTVNAIVSGCNQKNNRDPHTDLDDADVMNALHELRKLGAAEEMDWLGRVPKYRHLAYDWLSVNRAELAVLAELMLRGPQTLGELRGRAARMEPVADVAELAPIVAGLVQQGLMVELTPPGRGQLVTHGLYPPEELDRVRGAVSGAAGPSHPEVPTPATARASAPAPPAPAGPSGGAAPRPAQAETRAMDELRAEVAALRRQVQELEERLDRLEG